MWPNVENVPPNGVDKLFRCSEIQTVTVTLQQKGAILPLPDARTVRLAGRRLSPRAEAGLWLTLTFWGSNYVLLTLGTALSGNPHVAAIAGMRILTTALGLLFCYGIHLLLGHPKLRTTKRRLITLAIVAPVAAETFAWAAFFAAAAVDPVLGATKFTWSGAISTISFWTWFFLAWSGLYLALMYSFDVGDEQKRAAELKEEAHTAQLRALHSQINPHFLFNSLNSVSALILDKQTELAEEMVEKLATFLRLGLAADPKAKIPLALEIELQRSYLDIERLRYPDLQVVIDIPDEVEDALIPSLLLQPIVENAIKYGVASSPPPVTLTITAKGQAEELLIEIVDSGTSGSSSNGAGIGLANVRQRLALMYGSDQASLTAGRDEHRHFKVTLAFPLEHA